MSKEEFDLEDGSRLEILTSTWADIKEDQNIASSGRMLWYREIPHSNRKIAMFRLIASAVVIETVSVVRDGESRRFLGFDGERFRGTRFPLESFTYPEIFMALDSLGAFDGRT